MKKTLLFLLILLLLPFCLAEDEDSFNIEQPVTFEAQTITLTCADRTVQLPADMTEAGDDAFESDSLSVRFTRVDRPLRAVIAALDGEGLSSIGEVTINGVYAIVAENTDGNSLQALLPLNEGASLTTVIESRGDAALHPVAEEILGSLQ